MLKHRDQPGGTWPSGGYLYFQPETNWYSSPGLTFWQTVDEIVAMRLKNPRFNLATDRNTVADELDLFTCIRLSWNPQWCTTEKKNPRRHLQRPQPTSPARATLGGVVAAAADRVENFGAGVGVVLDWLGDSLEPVAPELAEKRAQVCATCPMNTRGDWLQRLEGFAASGVKQLIELANDLDLKTSYDEQLFYCTACDCNLRLKAHTKLEHIKVHTSERQKQLLDPRCWILNER